jgi:hypothetical protein
MSRAISPKWEEADRPCPEGIFKQQKGGTCRQFCSKIRTSVRWFRSTTELGFSHNGARTFFAPSLNRQATNGKRLDKEELYSIRPLRYLVCFHSCRSRTPCSPMLGSLWETLSTPSMDVHGVIHGDFAKVGKPVVDIIQQ